MPRLRQTYASARPKLPALAHTSGFAPSSRPTKKSAPRPLKLRTGLLISTLSVRVQPSSLEIDSETTWGLFRKTGSIRCAASRMRASDRRRTGRTASIKRARSFAERTASAENSSVGHQDAVEVIDLVLQELRKIRREAVPPPRSELLIAALERN